MQETLLVCSRSTKKYLPEYSRTFVVTGAATKEILDFEGSEASVVAIGGGAVIDTAKIISKNPITCYPTTAAGSSNTSHSVCWDGTRKLSIKREVPKDVYVVEDFIRDLPPMVKENTMYDVLSHCLDSMWSVNKTRESTKLAEQALDILKQDYTNSELVEAGNIAGTAIEICPTTILHSLSYPITAFYNISHGRALGYLLPRVCDYMNFDFSEYNKYPPVDLPAMDYFLIANNALRYNKIHDTMKKINVDTLIGILSS